MRRRAKVCLLVYAASFGLAACSGGGSPPPNVATDVDLSQTFDCKARDCMAHYRSFPEDHADQAHPQSDEEIAAQIAAIDAASLPEVVDIAPRTFRSRVAEILNIQFMLDGLDERPLHATVFEETEQGTYTARRMIFSDPLVGEFDVLALDPHVEGRRPAVIGLHGHFDSPAVFARDFLGAELAEAGYFVLMPQFRAMNCIGPEQEFTFSLLRGGFHLIAMRVYETLLMEKYLRASERVDAARIGLLTHSGGSSTGNLAVQLTDGIAAHVTDYYVDWRDRCFDGGPPHCETVPGMFPLGANLRDARYAQSPTLNVEYAFESADTRALILDFFDRTLHNRR
jgi:hypothetical protein